MARISSGRVYYQCTECLREFTGHCRTGDDCPDCGALCSLVELCSDCGQPTDEHPPLGCDRDRATVSV